MLVVINSVHSPSGHCSNTIFAISPADSDGLKRNSFVLPLTRIRRRLILKKKRQNSVRTSKVNNFWSSRRSYDVKAAMITRFSEKTSHNKQETFVHNSNTIMIVKVLHDSHPNVVRHVLTRSNTLLHNETLSTLTSIIENKRVSWDEKKTNVVIWNIWWVFGSVLIGSNFRSCIIDN